MSAMTDIAALAIAPTFVKGVLAVVCAVILFIGSIYLLCSAVFGLRMGYLVLATSLFAWMIVFAALWAFGAPGTLRNVGPRGTEAHWQVFSAASQPTTSVFPETATYPGDGWWVPASSSPSAASIPTVTTAFQTYLAAQAQQQLEEQGETDVEVDPDPVRRAERPVLNGEGRYAPGGGDRVLLLGRAGDHRVRVPRQRQRARLLVGVPDRRGRGLRHPRAVPGPRGEEPQGDPHGGHGSRLVRTGLNRDRKDTTTMLAITPVTDGSTAFILFTVMMVLIFVTLMIAIRR